MRKIKSLVLIIIVISIVFFISRTSSRYILEENLSGDIYFEIPYLAINATIPTQEMKPFSYTTFEFSLDNFVGDDISEVPMNYYISLKNETKINNEAQEIQRNYTDYSYQVFDITDNPNNPVELNFVSNKGFETSLGYGTKQTKNFLVKLTTNYSYYELLNTTDVYRIYVDSEDYSGESGYKLRRTVDFNGHTTSTYNELSTTVTSTNNANEFNINIANTNSYTSRFKISCSNTKLDMEYTDYDNLNYYSNGFIDIPAGDTANVKVKFTKKTSENYTNDIIIEADGSEYVPVGINITINEWVGLPVRTIAQNQKIYLKSILLTLDTLNVGDFVAYTPSPTIANNTYIVNAAYSGAVDSNNDPLNQNIEADLNLKWIVLNINKQDQTVDLISGDGFGELQLGGAQGYNNGVYLLNDICSELCSNSSIGATARSLKMMDIMDKLYSTNDVTTWTSAYGYSNFGEFAEITYKVFPTQWNNHDRNCVVDPNNKIAVLEYFSESGSLIDGTNTPSTWTSNVNEQLICSLFRDKKNDNVTIGTVENSKKFPWSYRSSDAYAYYHLFISGQRYNIEKCRSWVATRWIYPKRNNEMYGGMYRLSGGIYDISLYNVNSGTQLDDGYSTLSIRPIVTLPVEYININETVEMQVNKSDIDITSVNAYKVENTSLFNTVNNNPSSGE